MSKINGQKNETPETEVSTKVEGVEKMEVHIHFICKKCGKKAIKPLIPYIENEVKGWHGKQIRVIPREITELTFICYNCQNKKREVE